MNKSAMDIHVCPICSLFLGLYLGMELSIIPVISVLRSLKQEDCYEFETSYPDSPELQCETLSKNKINKKLKRPINVFFTCLCSPGSNRYPDWVRAGATQNQAMPDSLMAEWYAF